MHGRNEHELTWRPALSYCALGFPLSFVALSAWTKAQQAVQAKREAASAKTQAMTFLPSSRDSSSRLAFTLTMSHKSSTWHQRPQSVTPGAMVPCRPKASSPSNVSATASTSRRFTSKTVDGAMPLRCTKREGSGSKKARRRPMYANERREGSRGLEFQGRDKGG